MGASPPFGFGRGHPGAAEGGHRFSPLGAAANTAPAFPGANYSYVNVYSYGAVGDGKTDNTAAFQAAINAVAAAGGGTVLLNRGHFLLAGSINVLQGVTLEGTYASVPSHPMNGNVNLNTITGTLLMVTGGQANPSGTSFLTLQQDATVKGFVIYYPAQQPNQVPVPFPWTIDIVSNNGAVLDIECLNCWNFIRGVGAARHYIARIQGQPINIGVYLNKIYDIGRVENVHWNPWFTTDNTYYAWQLVNGRAFVIGRSDWEYVFNTFAFGYAIGYHFIADTDGTNCNGNFLGIGMDQAINASVQVDSAAPFGILITNGEFTAFSDAPAVPLVPGQVPAQVVISPTNAGSIRFVNSAFWGSSINIARIAGSGSVAFEGCRFDTWDGNNSGQYAIVAGGTGSLSVTSTEFAHDGNQIALGAQIDRAVIVANLFRGTQRVTGVQNSASFQVGFNAAGN